MGMAQQRVSEAEVGASRANGYLAIRAREVQLYKDAGYLVIETNVENIYFAIRRETLLVIARGISHQDAEDLVQTLYLKFLSNGNCKINSSSSPLPYLKKAIKNLWLDSWRNQTNMQPAFLKDSIDTTLGTQSDSETLTLLLDREELKGRIIMIQALRKWLSDKKQNRRRAVFDLYFLEYGPANISRKLQNNDNTVRIWQSRNIADLKILRELRNERRDVRIARINRRAAQDVTRMLSCVL